MATISHELRTPLNAIIGYNSLLEDGLYGEMNDKQHKAARRIDQNATRLLALINQLLELSRLEAGAVAIFPEKTCLVRLAREVVEDYQALADEKRIPLELSLPSEGLEVMTDGAKVREIIRQLVSNALKFTQQGAVAISIYPDGEGAVIEVRDTGPGISPELKETIFELFRQADASYTRPHEGAGLGLAIVRRLTNLLHIAVEVVSEKGNGSTFRLRLPPVPFDSKTASRPVEKASSLSPAPTEPAPAKSMFTEEEIKSVFIVDDDPYTVEILSEFLENRGHYRVTKSYSGMHAMMYLAKEQPDYLLVDLLMPQINGERVIQFCQSLWGRDGVTIVIITAKNLEESEKNRLKQFVHAIIEKGDLRPHTLAKTLESILPLQVSGCKLQASGFSR